MTIYKNCSSESRIITITTENIDENQAKFPKNPNPNKKRVVTNKTSLIMIACCTAGALVPNIIEGIKKNGWLNNYNDENPKKTMSQDSPLPKEQKGPIMAWSKCEVEIIDREQSPQTV